MGTSAGFVLLITDSDGFGQRFAPLDKFKMADVEGDGDNDDFLSCFADVPLTPPEKRDMCTRCK